MSLDSKRRRTLAGVAGLATATVAGCLELFGDDSLSLAGPVETQTETADWPLVHHDARHTNANVAATITRSEPEIVWRRSLPEGRYASNPVVVEGDLYVGGDELRRLDPATGETLATADEASWYHSVGYADGTLYAGLGTADGVALSAYEPTTLDRRWETSLPSRPSLDEVVLPPVATPQVIYGATTGEFFAVTPDGDLAWQTDGASNHERRQPAVAGDLLVWQSEFDVRIGPVSTPADPDHTAELDSPMWSSPTITDDYVLVGESIPFRPRLEHSTASLYALTHDGDLEWEIDVGSRVRTPAVADGVAHVVTSQYAGEAPGRCVGGNRARLDVEIAAIDLADGERRWTRPYDDHGTGLVPAPVRTAETVVAATTSCDGDHLLRAYDADDGDHLWTLSLDHPPRRMAAAGETVYVNGDGGLYAIG